MKHTLALFALLAACVSTAEAQQRRPPRRTPARAPVTAPAPAPTPAPSVGAGALDTRYVTRRAAGAWQPRCVATRGCATPRPISRCAQPAPNVRLAAAQSFGEVVDQRFQLSGQRVRVRGRLEAGGGCTEMACPSGVCCNHCSGVITLIGRATTSLHSLVLCANQAPAFTCTGDDSGLCCGTEVPAGDVVVEGVLAPIANSGGAWRIDGPTLCVE